MLDKVINKLRIILGLCIMIGFTLYFTPLGDIFNGEVERKIEEKKEEVKKEVKKVEKKVEDNIKEVEDKIKDLKKLKLKDIIG